MKQIAKSGKKIMFVATKKQAKESVAERVKAVGMPYVTERWFLKWPQSSLDTLVEEHRLHTTRRFTMQYSR